MLRRSRHRRAALAVAALVAVGLPGIVAEGAAAADRLPAGFVETRAFSNLAQPMSLRFAPDGRIFVAEKRGYVKVYDGLSDTTPTTIADLSNKVYNFWDRGLMSIELDPDFATTPYLYALYVYNHILGDPAAPPRWGNNSSASDPCPTPPGPTDKGCVASARLSRFLVQGSSVGPEQVLVEDWCQQFPTHSVGALAWGPDKALYVSAGDAASFNGFDYGQYGSPLNPCADAPVAAGVKQTLPGAQGGALRAQDLRTPGDPLGLDGTVIRVDRATGQGLPGNPRFASTNANERRVVAHGFRNPFRFTVRPGTEELWIGDVGWDTTEEIDRVLDPTDGEVDNFGWPCMEGDGRQYVTNPVLTLCQDLWDEGPGAVVAPWFAYAHAGPFGPDDTAATPGCPTGSSAVSGLAFYEGGPYPDAYDGALFVSDFSRRCIWTMLPGADGLPDPSTRRVFRAGLGFVDLVISPDGELFAIDFNNGTIRRWTYQDPNAPTARITASTTAGPAPLTVTFDGASSSSPSAQELSYAWDLDGDGQHDDAATATAAATYTATGTVRVSLEVTDESGRRSATTVTITVSPPGSSNTAPVPKITNPTASTTWKVGKVVSFAGSATDPQQGTLGAGALRWKLRMHHCDDQDQCHIHDVQEWNGIAKGSFTAPDHAYPSFLELQLTATDAGGLATTASVALQPKTVQLTVAANVTGVVCTINGVTAAAPLTRTVIIGSRNTLVAPSPQTIGSTTYAFSSWGDGGAATREVVAGWENKTYRANFTAGGGGGGATPPVAAYNFDQGSGTVLADRAGAHLGTIAGATWSTAGRTGGALSFDGIDDVVSIADAADLDLTRGMTIEAWVKPTAIGGSRALIHKANGSGYAWSLWSNTNAGNAPAGRAVVNGVDRRPKAANPLVASAWVHLALTFDGTTLRLYVNGAQAAQVAASGNLAVTAGVLRLGGAPAAADAFKGLLDDVRIYDRALTPAQLQADAATPVP